MSPPRAPAVSNPGPRSQSSVSSFGECGGVSTALRPRVWTGASRPFHLVVRRRSARGARWLSPGAETRASCRLPPRGGSRRKRWGVDATPALRRLPRARSALALWLHRSTRTRSSTRRAQTRSRAARTCPGTREPPEFEGTRGRPDSGRRLRFPPAVPAAAPGCRRRNASRAASWLPVSAGSGVAPCLPATSPFRLLPGGSQRLGRVAQATLPRSSTVWVRWGGAQSPGRLPVRAPRTRHVALARHELTCPPPRPSPVPAAGTWRVPPTSALGAPPGSDVASLLLTPLWLDPISRRQRSAMSQRARERRTPISAKARDGCHRATWEDGGAGGEPGSAKTPSRERSANPFCQKRSSPNALRSS